MITILITLSNKLETACNNILLYISFRYVGAFGTVFYALLLPCVVHYVIRKKENRLNAATIFSYIYVVTFGVSNCIGQIIIS